MNATAPGQFHCVRGSFDDRRRAVAELDRQAAPDPSRPPSPAPTAHRSPARTRNAPTQPDPARREQISRWHGKDRAVDNGAVENGAVENGAVDNGVADAG